MRNRTWSILAMLAAASTVGFGQVAVSARAGLIHYAEGRVLVDDQRLEQQRNTFVSMDEGETLATRRGRAEILLNPGTFLRMAEQSAFLLSSSALTDTRVVLLSGTALIEVDDLDNDNSVLVELEDQQVMIRKNGLYHFEMSDNAAVPSRLRVYDGEAWVGADLTVEKPEYVKAKKGRQVDLDGNLDKDAEKFDRDETDELYRWSARRARYIARANASSARSIRQRRPSGWIFNPFYGMYSFVPGGGYGYSPWGLTIYSPGAIRMALQPRILMPTGFGSSGGFSGPSTYGLGSGGGSVARPASAAPAPAPAPAAPTSGGGGGRRR